MFYHFLRISVSDDASNVKIFTELYILKDKIKIAARVATDNFFNGRFIFLYILSFYSFRY